jgi:hypothetical protein
MEAAYSSSKLRHLHSTHSPDNTLTDSLTGEFYVDAFDVLLRELILKFSSVFCMGVKLGLWH